MRSPKPLMLYDVCVLPLLSKLPDPCGECDSIVFTIRARRTGIDAATIVIAVSAVAKSIRVIVATETSSLVGGQ